MDPILFAEPVRYSPLGLPSCPGPGPLPFVGAGSRSHSHHTSAFRACHFRMPSSLSSVGPGSSSALTCSGRLLPHFARGRP
ncbi:unnamed protein product [Protopolystoma xenopodis]|uniref:Uncharacterized protein n=1 Tax=Protopolystoma xenopodis TaxID=117903 RepID=A0A3S5B0Y0_9PLAT|nr:unnamed protein product [Protopolystoma xenopodis]